MAQHRKEKGRVEEHDKKVRTCTREPVKGNEGQEQWKREKTERGKRKKVEKRYPAKTARHKRGKPKRLGEKETKISRWGEEEGRKVTQRGGDGEAGLCVRRWRRPRWVKAVSPVQARLMKDE